MNKSFVKAPPRFRELLARRRLDTGFSMLEAVVVVGVLLALAVSGFFAYGPITENAKKAKVKSAASEVYTGVVVADSDGDSNTKPQDVIDKWNASTDAIKVKILDQVAGSASDKGDFCVSATNVSQPLITALQGSCENVTDGSNPGGNGGGGVVPPADPYDVDGDGTPNDSDDDIDGDEIPNASDPDIDGDGTPNDSDPEPNGKLHNVVVPVSSGVMTSVWDTSLPGCTTITIPLMGNVNATINWGDGSSESVSTALPTHTYTGTPGAQSVSIDGTFSTWNGDDPNLGWSRDCITKVTAWGETGTTDAFYGFSQTPNLTEVARMPKTVTNFNHLFFKSEFNGDINGWDTSSVTDMTSMFERSSFNGELNGWDTSSVTDMTAMFHYDSVFNHDLNNWNTSKVTIIYLMFRNASAFNGEINSWDTSNVTDMSFAFHRASAFNKPLNNWNISKSLSLNLMFSEASSFNQDLSNWDTSNVQVMNKAFKGASSFNQDLSNWNTSNVEYMNSMFLEASAFNGNVSTWDTSKVVDMSSMFGNTPSFNQSLSDWNTSNVQNMAYMFRDAYVFNSNISGWNTSSVTDMNQMFNQALVFNQDLSGWNVSNTSQSGNFGTSSGLTADHLPNFP